MQDFEIKKLLRFIPAFLLIIPLVILILSVSGLKSGSTSKLDSKSMAADGERMNRKFFEEPGTERMGETGYDLFMSFYPEYSADKTALSMIVMNKYEETGLKYEEKLAKIKELTLIKDDGRLRKKLTLTEMAEKLKASGVLISDGELKLIYALSESSSQNLPEMFLSAKDFITMIPSLKTDYEKLYRGLETIYEKTGFLTKYSDSDFINGKYKINDLCDIFGFDKTDIAEFMKYYNGVLPDGSEMLMTLPELSDFLVKHVIDNEEFDSYLTPTLKNDIKKFTRFADKDLYNRQLGAGELSELLGADRVIIGAVIRLKEGIFNDTTDLESFTDYLIENAKTEGIIGSNIDAATLMELRLLKEIITAVKTDKTFTSKEVADLFGFKTSLTKKLYEYKIELEKPEDEPIPEELDMYSFMSFLAEKLPKMPGMSIKLHPEDAKQFEFYRQYMESVLEKRSFDSKGLYEMIKPIAPDFFEEYAEIAFIIAAADGLNPGNSLSLYDIKDFKFPASYENYLDGITDKTAFLSAFLTEAENVFSYGNYSRIVMTAETDSAKGELYKKIKKIYKELKKEPGKIKVYLSGPAIVKLELGSRYIIRIVLCIFAFIILGFIQLALLAKRDDDMPPGPGNLHTGSGSDF